MLRQLRLQLERARSRARGRRRAGRRAPRRSRGRRGAPGRPASPRRAAAISATIRLVVAGRAVLLGAKKILPRGGPVAPPRAGRRPRAPTVSGSSARAWRFTVGSRMKTTVPAGASSVSSSSVNVARPASTTYTSSCPYVRSVCSSTTSSPAFGRDVRVDPERADVERPPHRPPEQACRPRPGSGSISSSRTLCPAARSPARL